MAAIGFIVPKQHFLVWVAWALLTREELFEIDLNLLGLGSLEDVDLHFLAMGWLLGICSLEVQLVAANVHPSRDEDRCVLQLQVFDVDTSLLHFVWELV